VPDPLYKACLLAATAAEHYVALAAGVDSVIRASSIIVAHGRVRRRRARCVPPALVRV